MSNRSEKTPAELGLEAAYRLKDIEIARFQRQLWHKRLNQAATQLDRWEEEIKRLEQILRGEDNQ